MRHGRCIRTPAAAAEPQSGRRSCSFPCTAQAPSCFPTAASPALPSGRALRPERATHLQRRDVHEGVLSSASSAWAAWQLLRPPVDLCQARTMPWESPTLCRPVQFCPALCLSGSKASWPLQVTSVRPTAHRPSHIAHHATCRSGYALPSPSLHRCCLHPPASPAASLGTAADNLLPALAFLCVSHSHQLSPLPLLLSSPAIRRRRSRSAHLVLIRSAGGCSQSPPLLPPSLLDGHSCGRRPIAAAAALLRR